MSFSWNNGEEDCKNIFLWDTVSRRFIFFLFFMKKYLALYAAICATIVVPALFADTTGTGATTATGTTNTGVTNTGTSNTGTTNTGSTGTGANCTVGTGFQMSLISAQEKYAIELTRLITEKKTAYLAAMTLTGTAKVDAIKVANLKFKTGHQLALEALSTVKKEEKSSFFHNKTLCTNNRNNMRREHNNDDERIGHETDDNGDDRDHNRKRGKDDNKSQMKDLKKSFKEMEKMEKKFSKHR